MELNPKYTTVVRYVNTDDKADPPIGYLNINNPAHIPDEQLKSRSYKRVRDMFNTIASGLPSYEVTMIPKGGHLEFTVSLKPHCKPDSDMKWALPCCMSPNETYDLFDQVKLIWMHPYHALRVGRMKMAECQKCRASFANDQLDELVIHDDDGPSSARSSPTPSSSASIAAIRSRSRPTFVGSAFLFGIPSRSSYGARRVPSNGSRTARCWSPSL